MVAKKDNILNFINDKRYGGMSESEFLFNWINFSYWQNIDIFTNPKWVTLSKDFSEITMAPATTFSGNITKILRLPNNIQSNAYFTDDGKIYIDSWAGAALVHTLAIADKKILQAVTFSTFVIFFTSWAFHRITFTSNDFKTFASCTETVQSFTASYQWFTAADSLDFPVYNYSDSLLYRGGGRYLFNTPNTFATVSTPLTLPIWDKIVGLSFLNSNLKIYVNHYNTNSKLFFRNEIASDHIIFDNKVFKGVVTDWQLDYVVCTDWLYIFSWYQGVKVFDNDFSTFWLSWAVNCIPQNLLGMDPYFWYVGHEHKLYKFWKKYTSLKNWIVVDKLFANHITALWERIVYSWTVFMASDDKKAYSKSLTLYNTTWYLETAVFYWTTLEKRKRVNKIFSAFKLISWETIQFFFSIDWAAYPWSPQFTISNYNDKRKEYYKSELTWLTNHRVKVKIVINSVTTYITTPTLLEFDMFEEFIDNIG